MKAGRLILIAIMLAVAAYAQRTRNMGRFPPEGPSQPSLPASVTTNGMLRTTVGTQFVLEANDHRIVTYRTESATRMKKDGEDVTLDRFQSGDHLTVDSTRDDQGYYTATRVMFKKAGTPEEHTAAAATWDLPRLVESLQVAVVLSPSYRADTPANDGAAPATTAPTPALAGDDEIIAKAREMATSFAGVLPDFFCRQVTTRYQTQHNQKAWHAMDVVTADVAYEAGRETYKNIKVDNKPVDKPMEDIEGARSTGEFSSLEQELLSAATGAVFHRTGQETLHGHATWIYKFEVPRERSHWRIEAPSELYYPAYQGTVWIEQETSRVLRIKQQGRNLPTPFPFDTIETATEYDFVRLATVDPVVLPVNAEMLSCTRGGAGTCLRNRIEFRNYRKFGAESNLTFDDR